MSNAVREVQKIHTFIKVFGTEFAINLSGVVLENFGFLRGHEYQCLKMIAIRLSLNFQNHSLVFQSVFECGNFCAKVEST